MYLVKIHSYNSTKITTDMTHDALAQQNRPESPNPCGFQPLAGLSLLATWPPGRKEASEHPCGFAAVNNVNGHFQIRKSAHGAH